MTTTKKKIALMKSHLESGLRSHLMIRVKPTTDLCSMVRILKGSSDSDLAEFYSFHETLLERFEHAHVMQDEAGPQIEF